MLADPACEAYVLIRSDQGTRIVTDAVDRLKVALADRYNIEREIGRGGMATVYLAEDLKHHRKVAVKVLRPELAQALGSERFHQEIEIAAQLTHPHILPLHDSGDADGYLYFVMPYIEGESLRDKLAKKGELPIAEAVRVLRDVVEALSHAHKHNVVHRDIKPDNVMLSERHALVTDFGVAKAVSEATGRHKLTTEGVALGTPAYMAPEQASADPHIDHRADIYAIGIIAYELLTGRTPFVGNTQQELLAAHVTQIPDPVTKYRDSVPPALAHLVMRCLEKKAADRWQTAEELIPQLEALATPSGGVTPTGMMPVNRAAKRRWMVAGGAVAVAVIIVGIVVMAALPRASNVALDPDHVVVSVFRNATGDPSLDRVGERTAHWITQGLQQASVPVTPWDLSLQSWDYVLAETEAGRVRDPVRALADETGAGTVISGAVYLVGDDSLEVQMNVTDAIRGRSFGTIEPLRGSRAAESEMIAEVQQKIMVYLAGRFDERLGDWAFVISAPPSFEAYQAYLRGLRLHWQLEHEQALRYYQQAFDSDSTWAAPLTRMQAVLYNMGRLAERDSLTAVLEGMWEHLTPFERIEVEYRAAMRDGERERLLSTLRRGIELAPGSPLVYNYAMQLRDANRPREAVNVLGMLNPEHGWVREWAGYWDIFATSLHMLGQYEQVIEVLHKCGELHPEYTFCRTTELQVLATMGRVDEINELLDEILAMPGLAAAPEDMVYPLEFLRLYGPASLAVEAAEKVLQWLEARPLNETTRLNNRHEYGRTLFFAGRIDEAQQVFDMIVDDFPNDVVNRTHRAFIAASRGDTALALSDAQVLDDQAEVLSGRQKDMARWWGRGVIFGVLGDQDRAWELFRQFAPRWVHGPWQSVRVLYEPMRGYPPFEEMMRPKG